MATDPTLPRRVALDLMGDVIEDRRLLSEVLPKRLAKLAPEDRARTQRLVTTAFRVMDRADRALGPHLRKRPPPRILNLLRLSVAEICAEGSASHGVVNSAVAIARADKKTAGMAGLVNAVLRKIDPDAWSALPPPRLPKWLRKPLTDDYGKDVVAAMEAAFHAGAPLDLTPRGDGAALAERLGGQLLPTGSVRLTDAGQVSALPGFSEGDWWVQDAAAALPARILAARPGESVLDLCAAPGGKTMQLAATGADVTAVDISSTRMARVEENLARCNLSADLVTADALEYEGGPFDAILLDAPCTATGTIRRHPDLPYAKDGSEFPGLFELQEHLIDRALGMLKPGGRLVYCTCSLLIDEGEEQVRDALDRNPGPTVDPTALDRPGIEPGWRTDEGGLRLRPDYWAETGGMDGFYIACLVKA
ncbi:transcription antitermination factor NusB [Maritimibacter sp. UBA3975]|uniref:RsmB/NOP family class I SAM-dependent RNA methyltransferase n=1 Tax=Maritimibacter sp. UBA3975 TaxID=1946833 RepID=UPI000C08F83B|nr:transcription antitermination factor NusB [Maritimibacter sp. UBA3975]MAM63618.1 16S rRNA methyltransferase [Maritimibacter sp.]|tara:strand:- start:415 stop:1677 length:1263 start_codon:yes stop_codon:yes gene_type:complete